MASLARIRPSIARRIVRILLARLLGNAHNSFSFSLRLHALLPPLQTPPCFRKPSPTNPNLSPLNFTKTPSKPTNATHLPWKSKSKKTNSSKCTKTCRPCVAWKWQPTPSTKPNSSVVSAISLLDRQVLLVVPRQFAHRAQGSHLCRS